MSDQVTSTGNLDGHKASVLPNETLARWISVGGLLEVFRELRRWVEQKADISKDVFALALLSALVSGCCCASKETICKNLPQAEK